MAGTLKRYFQTTRLSNMAREYNYFTQEEKQFLKENYLLLSDAKLAEIFSRTETNIRKARQLFGLKRRGVLTKEFIENIPIVVWFPRNAFKDANVDLKQLKIQGK